MTKATDVRAEVRGSVGAEQQHRTPAPPHPRTSEPRTGAQILCEAFIRQGVDTIFGIPGGAIMPFYHALPGMPKIVSTPLRMKASHRI